MQDSKIATDFPYPSKFAEVDGAKMHYVEKGDGDIILLLHTMPSCNYVWRNVIPHVARLGRCIAPDLIGMGKSDKPDIEYTVFDHIKYLEQFIEKLNLKNITLVLHGWGSVIGFDYAMRNEKNCKGLIFYESYVRPFHGDDVSLPLQEQLLEFDAEGNIFDSLANGALFVDKILSQESMRVLTEAEKKYYRDSFKSKGSDKPLRQYFKELPRINTQSYVDKLIADYSEKLVKSKLPKLMLYSVPGFITTMATLMWAKENLPNIELIDVGEELHYAQESNPTLMGEAISIWLQGLITINKKN